MRKFKLLILLLFFTFSVPLLAQNLFITGTVNASDEKKPLIGASVIVKGTTIGTITDANGKFSISVPKDSHEIEFTYIGYIKETVVIYGNDNLEISLIPDLAKLEEVVVVGYGTTTNKRTTGAVTQVSGKKIENLPIATIDQALQGNVAGLQLGATSGTPGSVQDIRIRGVNSITASKDPLYVVDGVPIVTLNLTSEDGAVSTVSSLTSLNSNDVQSITVLKDAASTAVFGARGANGVILVTTKSGSQGKTTFTVNAERGWAHNAVKGQDVLNASQWDELWYEAKANKAGSSVSDWKSSNPTSKSGWDGVTNTNWGDIVERNHATQQQYNISASGGTEKSQHFFSLGYFSQQATTIGADLERFNGKVNLSTQLRDNLRVSNNASGAYTVQNSFLELAAYYSNPRLTKYFYKPIWKAYNDDGSINLNTGSLYNPLYVTANNINRTTPVRVNDVSTVEWKLFKKLIFSSKYSIDYLVTERKTYQDKDYGDAADQEYPGYIQDDYIRNFNWVWQNSLGYSLNINSNNKLDAKFIYEAQKNKYYYLSAAQQGIPAKGLPNLDTNGKVYAANSHTLDWASNSYLLALNYAFYDKVFIDATIRREGSSKFSPDNRWGNFYSLGAAYVLSEESFFKNFKNWLTLLKVRGSYGRTGNSGIGEYKYQALLGFDEKYNNTTAAYPSQFGNTNLSWEKSDILDLGISYGLFHGRISGDITLFRKKTFDLLQEVPLSLTTGHDVQVKNVGELVNKGIEASIDIVAIQNSLITWRLGANVTLLKNEVTKLAKDAAGNDIEFTNPDHSQQKVAVGHPVYGWYVPTWAGVDPANGDPLWYVSGSSGATINEYNKAGRDYHGSPIPTLYGGINTSVEIKGFYLDASLYGSFGNKIYDQWARYTQSDGQFTGSFTAISEQYTKRWKQAGDNVEVPRIVSGGNKLSNSVSSRFLYNGAFLRLRNVSLGYKVPDRFIKATGISNAQIYVRGTNLLTYVIDKRLNYDPEVAADGFIGLTNPPVKTVSVGLKFNF